MKKFFKEFGDFIKRGNVLDLAIGIIIGTSFNAIVRSLVNDILMPVIGLIGGKNVADASVVLVPAVIEGDMVITEAVLLKYDMFLQSIIDFLIIALTVFVIVKLINNFRNSATKLQKKGRVEEEVVSEPVVKSPSTEELLTEIRDLLKKDISKEWYKRLLLKEK